MSTKKDKNFTAKGLTRRKVSLRTISPNSPFYELNRERILVNSSSIIHMLISSLYVIG